MENVSKTACSEMVEVLQHVGSDVFSKIPATLRDYIYTNRDLSYIPNIDFTKDNWEDTLEEDAKSLLALIYRDYVVSKEEHQQLLKQEETMKMEAFRSGSLNPKTTASSETTKETVGGVPATKDSIFKKVIQFFKNIFRKKD